MFRVNGYAVTQIRYNGAIITDVPQRLSSCTIDRYNGTIDYTIEGDENHYTIYFAVGENSVIYTWPDGFTCTITIH